MGIYNLDKRIGSGSHAVVWQGRDLRNGEKVALKQMKFEGETIKRAYREVKLLQHFASHDNIVTPLDLISADNRDEFDTVFFVMELCSTDLHKLLRSSQKITPPFVKLFSYQLIRAVKALHNANVIHRDLKPQNILVTQNSQNQIRLVLCDFGTGRFDKSTEQDFGSELRRTSLQCVTTALYCAPEGILKKDVYSSSVDIWAIGCIIAEIIKRTPLFQGRDFKHQLTLMVELCKPSQEELLEFPDSTKRKHLLDYECRCVESISDKLPPETDNAAIDLLKNLLVFHPNKRYNANQAYHHSFLEPLNKNQNEKYIEPFPDFEENRTTEEWKDLLWKEVEKFNSKRNSNTKEPEDLWDFS